jgi:hypothetical protein
MPHRFELREFMGIFTFSDGGMVARDLLNAVLTELIKACVADVSDRCTAVVYKGCGQHAGHPAPLRSRAGETMDFVIRARDRFPDTLNRRSRLPFEPGSYYRQGYVCSLAAGRLTANAVNYDEDAVRDVDMVTVFVNVAQASRIRSSSSKKCIDGAHDISRDL